MLMPKRVKYRNKHKGRMKGKSKGGTKLHFGSYGIQAISCGFVDSRQIEACRIAITRKIKRGGKLWIQIFPDKPLTGKPAETRMGKGKGSIERWVSVVKPGRVLFELEGVDKELAHAALRLGQHKLPIKTRIITRDEYGV